MPNSLEVRNYMQAKPVTVSPEMSVHEAAKKIQEHKVSGAAVVDTENNLVGMLSELDCLRSLVNAIYNGNDPGGALVSDIMTRDVIVNQPGEDIVSVAASMLERKQRRRPVVENGKLIGQVTCRQILAAIQDFR
ncbi:MAG: CBS domain-containing protein [Pseudomonadales bacterium]|nr:CBS domain-containing protein [Pseudomonadales bacterium]